jgi:hypothetical protein
VIAVTCDLRILLPGKPAILPAVFLPTMCLAGVGDMSGRVTFVFISMFPVHSPCLFVLSRRKVLEHFVNFAVELLCVFVRAG